MIGNFCYDIHWLGNGGIKYVLSNSLKRDIIVELGLIEKNDE
jgi:hypothetical protein